MIPRNGDKRGRIKKKELGSDGLANETRSQQLAAIDSLDSRIGHRRFRARPSDDHEVSCLPGERG